MQLVVWSMWVLISDCSAYHSPDVIYLLKGETFDCHVCYQKGSFHKLIFNKFDVLTFMNIYPQFRAGILW